MKTDFLNSPFYYGFRTAREKYGFRAGYGMQTKVEFFWEQANTARATPSDPQRINHCKFRFADLVKLLIGKYENSSDKRFEKVFLMFKV